MAERIHIDYETFSHLSLPDVGVGRYSRDPSTEALMAAWSRNDVEQQQWIPAEHEPIPAELKEGLEDPHVEKWAWNAPFEINITRNVLGIETPLESWRDTMVLSYTCSLPGKLEKAGPVVDLDAEHLKDRRGGTLMRKFSSLQKATKRLPERRIYWYQAYSDWLDYLSYNRQDEISERAIYHRLKHYMPSQEEWEMWFIDQRINEAGIPINMRMVSNAIRIYEHALKTKLSEMKLLTGLDNPNSRDQLLPWLQDNGYPFDDLIKGHISRAIERAEQEGMTDQDPYLRVLLLKSETSRTSPKKFYALERAVDPVDEVLRYAFQFAGAARTWRWGGRLFQPQNLPRPMKKLEKNIEVHARNVERLDPESFNLVYDKPMDVLASVIRPAAQAPDGYVFVDADLSAIENIILGWLSGCEKILRVFRLGRDPYLSFGCYLFKKTYEEMVATYESGNGWERMISKPGTLGCGYMLSAGQEFYDRKTGEREGTGLLGYAWNMGIKEFTLEQSKLSVDTFRNEFEEVKDYWYGIERAAKKCIRTGRKVRYGVVAFDRKGPFMRMLLPSGRALHYCRPRIEQVMAPWGKLKDSITYETLNDKKQWQRESTHPGKLTENADQAIARDILAFWIRKAVEAGYDVRIHVHDQQVLLVREDHAEEVLKVLLEILKERPEWAADIPLTAAGFISKMFKKD